MADDRAHIELPGELDPEQLAARLGWPVEIVIDLIRQGLITNTGDSWVIDASDEIRKRWARALWSADLPDEGDDEEAP